MKFAAQLLLLAVMLGVSGAVACGKEEKVDDSQTTSTDNTNGGCQGMNDPTCNP